MSRNIEIEFKNIVSQTDFQKLKDFFHINKSNFFEQTNHYFDTADFSLREKGAALRVRQLTEKYELTLKKPAKIGLLEINQNLTSDEAKKLISNTQFPNGEIKLELANMDLDIEDFKYFGSLTTLRAEIEYKQGLLVFDHSFYHGMEDFEIEYEVLDWETGKTVFNQLMQSLNIPIKSTDNKIRRFYNAKNQQIK